MGALEKGAGGPYKEKTVRPPLLVRLLTISQEGQWAQTHGNAILHDNTQYIAVKSVVSTFYVS